MNELGVDIEEISRFSKKPFIKNKTFYKKIFTEDEIKYCLSKSNPYPHFTVRFCAKEATIKALKNKKFALNKISIEIKNNIPFLKINQKRIGKVSLSHTENIGIAIVLL